MQRPRRMPKESICWLSRCSKSATRRTPGSWPTPANCFPIFWPGRVEPEARNEYRSDALSQPRSVAPVAGFDLRAGAVSGDCSRNTLAGLDDEPCPELLSWNLRRLLHTESLSCCAHHCPVRGEDGSGTEAGAALAGGCDQESRPETTVRIEPEGHRGGLARDYDSAAREGPRCGAESISAGHNL